MERREYLERQKLEEQRQRIEEIKRQHFEETASGLKSAVSGLNEASRGGAVPLDIVFCLDESGSVSARDFTTALKFIKNIVAGLGTPDRDVAFGVIGFSTEARLQCPISRSYAEISTKLKKWPRIPGGTATDRAFAMALQAFKIYSDKYPRRDSLRYVFLITDGRTVCSHLRRVELPGAGQQDGGQSLPAEYRHLWYWRREV